MNRASIFARVALVASLGSAPAASTHLSPIAPSSAWRVTLGASGGVEIVFYATVRFPTSTSWELYSREGGARDQVSWFKWMLAGLLGNRPAHGALLALSNGTATTEGEALALRGQLNSPFCRCAVIGQFRPDRWHAELHRGDEKGVVAGTLDAVPASATAPLRDYAAVAEGIRREMTGGIYDPSLPTQPAYLRFFDELRTSFSRARDDLEVIAAFQTAASRLHTSHIEFVRNPSMAAMSLDQVLAGDASVNPDNLVQVRFPAPGIAWLGVRSWDRVAGPIDRAFERIAASGASLLVLDIRGNRGGDATSMSTAGHLLPQAFTAGAGLSRAWYTNHRARPTPAELAQLPTISPDTPPLEILRQLDNPGAVAARIEPHGVQFAGEVYLVTDRKSGSASEPLAYALKQTRRAILVGERTAGALFLALPHALSDGFIVVFPKADYYTADGVRLEGNGVKPDIECASSEALIVIGKRIRRTRPYAGEVFLGSVYMPLGRLDDAERAFRAALAGAPTDADRARMQQHLNEIAARRATAR